ncbi:uncharacterized protein LOC136040555 isoform X2 [Artemia franciscana]|uniref:uncharacterized protein LOC136040555 isoform X2 n=1 Tax=Artemia franciscana TaxID=6661 RepID=UPI0032DB6F5D
MQYAFFQVLTRNQIKLKTSSKMQPVVAIQPLSLTIEEAEKWCPHWKPSVWLKKLDINDLKKYRRKRYFPMTSSPHSIPSYMTHDNNEVEDFLFHKRGSEFFSLLSSQKLRFDAKDADEGCDETDYEPPFPDGLPSRKECKLWNLQCKTSSRPRTFTDVSHEVAFGEEENCIQDTTREAEEEIVSSILDTSYTEIDKCFNFFKQKYNLE